MIQLKHWSRKDKNILILYSQINNWNKIIHNNKNQFLWFNQTTQCYQSLYHLKSKKILQFLKHDIFHFSNQTWHMNTTTPHKKTTIHLPKRAPIGDPLRTLNNNNTDVLTCAARGANGYRKATASFHRTISPCRSPRWKPSAVSPRPQPKRADAAAEVHPTRLPAEPDWGWKAFVGTHAHAIGIDSGYTSHRSSVTMLFVRDGSGSGLGWGFWGDRVGWGSGNVGF